MCLICDRIEMIKNGTNPYFVKELETWTRKNEGEVIVIRLPACRTDESMNCKFT